MKAQRNQRALGKWQGAEKTTGRWGKTTGRWIKRQGAAPCRLGLARTLGTVFTSVRSWQKTSWPSSRVWMDEKYTLYTLSIPDRNAHCRACCRLKEACILCWVAQNTGIAQNPTLHPAQAYDKQFNAISWWFECSPVHMLDAAKPWPNPAEMTVGLIQDWCSLAT